MVRVVDDFHKFLGPELKAVTGDAQGIDEVIQRVNAMVDPIQNLTFDVFDKSSMAKWAEVSAKFGQDKEQIERATRAFIDTSFKKLRSAEGALDLLQSFKSIKSEGAIGRQMMDKFSDILEQFSREIDHTREMFEANMEDCVRNMQVKREIRRCSSRADVCEIQIPDLQILGRVTGSVDWLFQLK